MMQNNGPARVFLLLQGRLQMAVNMPFCLSGDLC